MDPGAYDSRAYRGVTNLRQALRDVADAGQRNGVAAALAVIRDVRGLKDSGFLESCPAPQIDEQTDLFDALVEMAAGFGSVSEFLDQVTEVQKSEADDRRAGPAVVLTTAHRSKGLEWDQVFLVGVSEGIWPHSFAIRDGQVDEERRLAYVGVTRAKRYLTVTWRQFHLGAERKPSRYLDLLTGRTESAPQTWDLGPWKAWIRSGCPAGQVPDPPAGIQEI